MTSEKPHKYNNPDDLDELCRRFLVESSTDPGAAIEYCKSFLLLMNKRKSSSLAVLSSRVKSR